MAQRVPLSTAVPGAVVAALLACSPLALAQNHGRPQVMATPQATTAAELEAAMQARQEEQAEAQRRAEASAQALGESYGGGMLDAAHIETASPIDARKVKDRLDWPLGSHVLTSPYGARIDPITFTPAFHTGSDFALPCGSPVEAAADGVVESSGTAGDYGNRVVLKHDQLDGKDLHTTYSHLLASKVKAGDQVKKGDVIALEGTTGHSTGCHLHFEVVLDGFFTDPWTWLTGEATTAPNVKVGSLMPLGPIPSRTPSGSPTPSASRSASASPSPSSSGKGGDVPPAAASIPGTPAGSTASAGVSPSPSGASPDLSPSDPSPSGPGSETPTAEPVPSTTPTTETPAPVETTPPATATPEPSPAATPEPTPSEEPTPTPACTPQPTTTPTPGQPTPTPKPAAC